MRPEDQDLLTAALAEAEADDFRSASLERTLKFVRKRRRTRRLLRAAAATVCLATLAATAIWRRGEGQPIPPPSHAPHLAAAAVPTVPGTSIRVLSDDDLLALFPGRPVALLGPAHDRQLVFLDEPRN